MKAVDQLRNFRQTFERNTGLCASDIEVSLLHVLDDVCRALQLTPQERNRVLGKRGVTQMTNDREWAPADISKQD